MIIVGAGPRGIGVLERLAENLASEPALPGAPPLGIHLIDPFPPGAGRIWRRAQSPLLKLNSMAVDVTMFTDASSRIRGPIAPGPSLIEWAEGVRNGTIADADIDDPIAAAEIAALQPKSFPTRRLQSFYLDWFYRRALARLADRAETTLHRDTALGVDELPDGRQRVRLASGGHVDGELVVYALGHSGSEPDAESTRLARFAEPHGLSYLAPAFTADAELASLAPGETVIVRGMGLVAVDLLVLLTEGRGGRFVVADADDASGVDASPPAPGTPLRYLPSGQEPHILIGSRRGVPYHSKISSELVAERIEPRFFDAGIAARVAAEHAGADSTDNAADGTDGLDFAAHLWPLIAKEMLHGYYAELFRGHPDRVRVGWDEFVRRLEPLDPFGPELGELVAHTVLDPGDRLELESFNAPLQGLRVASVDELQEAVRAYIADDLARRTLPEHSATLGLFTSLLQASFALHGIAGSANWTARSRERDLEGWWTPYFSYVASGPPGHRLHELLALSDAGVVTFLGPNVTVEADAASGRFVARGSALDETFSATALVDAWLPPARAGTSDDPALRELIASGEGVEQTARDGERVVTLGKLLVRPGDARVVRGDGSIHPRRFAVGPYTSSPSAGAFARPGTDAVSFRENDAVARAVLHELGLLG